jgi:hypothetical protein
MIEYLLIGALLGWFGHGAIVTPPPSPLAVAECSELQPPADKTFGATTNALVQCVGTYKRCQTACITK